MEGLEPCPFCEQFIGSHDWVVAQEVYTITGDVRFQIHCTLCDFTCQSDKSMDVARKVWNSHSIYYRDKIGENQ